MKLRINPITAALIAALLPMGAANAEDAAPLKTLKEVATITIPAPAPVGMRGNFADYLMIDGHTLYIGFMSQSELAMVDTDTNTYAGAVTGLARPHGAASDGKFIYSSNGGDNTCSIINSATHQIVKSVPAGTGPDAIIYLPEANLVYVADNKGKTATLLKPETGETVATIATGGACEFPAYDPAAGVVFQPLEDTGEIVRVDLKKKAVTARWNIDAKAEPAGQALDTKNHRLFVACGNEKLVVFNTKSGKIVATLPIGTRTDCAVYDAARKRIYTANGGGTISVIHQDGPDKYTVLEQAVTYPRGHAMALDPKTGRIYLTHGDKITVYEPLP